MAAQLTSSPFSAFELSHMSGQSTEELMLHPKMVRLGHNLDLMVIDSPNLVPENLYKIQAGFHLAQTIVLSTKGHVSDATFD
jgi:hypothetical protein